MTPIQIDWKRIVIFIAFAFGMAWLVGLIIYLTGGLLHSPEIIPGSGITLALVLLAVGYMSAPALANVFTRLVTREGWQNTWLRPNFKRGWPFWLAGWLLPPLLIVLGGAIFFLLFPQFFDPNLTTVRKMLAISPQTAAVDPWIIMIAQAASGILISPIVNSLFTFGEEFGWRAYLLQKLLPLGKSKAVLLLGIIWGLWHAPVIAMGHNYGFGYWGAPWSGIVMMVIFTIGVGTVFAWLVLGAGSVWPAVIGHAVLNGFAAIVILVMQGEPNILLGPTTVGLIGGLPWLVFAFVLLLLPNALKARETLSVPVE